MQFITQFCRPVSTIALFRLVLNGSKLSLSRQLDFSLVHIKKVKTKYILFIRMSEESIDSRSNEAGNKIKCMHANLPFYNCLNIST